MEGGGAHRARLLTLPLPLLCVPLWTRAARFPTGNAPQLELPNSCATHPTHEVCTLCNRASAQAASHSRLHQLRCQRCAAPDTKHGDTACSSLTPKLSSQWPESLALTQRRFRL